MLVARKILLRQSSFCRVIESELIQLAAAKCQYQNSVEREVQTASKGIATLFIDQSALGPAFWCYAAEFWVHTANHTTGAHDFDGVSPLKIVTGRVPDISRDFQFPFGFPVTFHKTEAKATRDDWTDCERPGAKASPPYKIHQVLRPHKRLSHFSRRIVTCPIDGPDQDLCRNC